MTTSLITKQIKPFLKKYKHYCTGKMIRSNLICQIAKSVNPENNISEKVIKFAAQMEILHNATLLHDDVLDDEEIRRGKTSFNKTLGNKNSILLGDCMLANVSYEISQLENVEIMKNVALILKCFGKGELESKNYFYKIANKTAFFFAYILDSVLVLEGIEDTKIRKSFFDFGKLYGMYFQMVDDYLDYDEDKRSGSLNIVSELYEDKEKTLNLIALTLIKCFEILETVPFDTENLKQFIMEIDKEMLHSQSIQEYGNW